MEHTPLVSIVIPVYNGSNYMREAIDSALAQTYDNIEVLVVNDGSNDGGATDAIALSYGDKIRYFSKENGGVSTALNLGIEKMRGEYFSWLSHDDLYEPNKISMQLEALKACGDMTRLVYSSAVSFGESLPATLSRHMHYPDAVLNNSVMPVVRGLTNMCTLLVHKSHFERVGAFDETLTTAQDYDFAFRVFHRQNPIYVDSPLVKSRVHQNQGTKTISAFMQNSVDLWRGAADRFTEIELGELPGGAYWYYAVILEILHSLGDKNAVRYVYDKFMNTEIPKEVTPQLRKVSDCIASLSDGKASNIAIFCAGQFGTALYHDLKSRLIRVNIFADNDPKKHGYLFDGVYCVSRVKLKEQKNDTLVIVAAKECGEIVSQLKADGFPYVVTRDDLLRTLNETMPLKWVSDFELVEGVDYSSKDSQLLLTHFNKLIYDICKYYEDRS